MTTAPTEQLACCGVAELQFRRTLPLALAYPQRSYQRVGLSEKGARAFELRSSCISEWSSLFHRAIITYIRTSSHGRKSRERSFFGLLLKVFSSSGLGTIIWQTRSPKTLCYTCHRRAVSREDWRSTGAKLHPFVVSEATAPGPWFCAATRVEPNALFDLSSPQKTAVCCLCCCCCSAAQEHAQQQQQY